MKKSKNILWGLLLIAIGVIWGLYNAGILKFNLFFEGWWTLIIIVPSLIGLITDKDKVGNLIGVLIGGALLLACRHIISFELIWKLAVPCILVIIGLSFVFKDVIGKKVTDKIEELNKNELEDNCSTFSVQDVTYEGKEFEGTTLNAIFGGIKCNLSGSIIKKDAVINATSIFGGIDLIVPSDVKVIVKSSSIFGGVSDSRKNKNETDDSKVLYVNATCMFGGIEIK